MSNPPVVDSSCSVSSDSFVDSASQEDFVSFDDAEADPGSSTLKNVAASVMSRVQALMQGVVARADAAKMCMWENTVSARAMAAARAEAAKMHVVEYTMSARTMAGTFVEKSRLQTSNITAKALSSARFVTASAQDYVYKSKAFAVKSYQLGFVAVSGDIARRTTGAARSALVQSRTKAAELGSVAKGVAQDRQVQAATAGAAVGSAALGAAGGAAGLATGTTLGSATGLLFAPFTLGLSIPIGAIIGGGSGLVGGVVVGGTAGALSGGVAGVGAYAKRHEINKGTEFFKREVQAGTGMVKSRLSTGADLVKGKAGEGAVFVRGNADVCKSFLKEKVSDARMRLVRSGTGGTEPVEANIEN